MENLKVWDWRFLDEPAWRWAMFFVVLSLFLGVWSEVLRHMRSAT